MSPVTALEPTSIGETPEPTCAPPTVATPATRKKPRVWTAFVTFFLALVAGQVAVAATVFTIGVGVGFVMGAQGADGAAIQTRIQEIFTQPLFTLLTMFLPCQLGMAAVLFFAARRSSQPIKERLGLMPPSGRKIGVVQLAALAAFTVSVAWASLVVGSLFFGRTPSGDTITNAVAGASLHTITLVSILLCVIAVVVEECLFRGYLQRRFLERWSPAVAISVSTLLFAIVHLDSLQHIVAVLALGSVTGLVAYRSQSVRPSMIVHALHNVAVVGFTALAPVLAANIGQERLGQLFLGLIATLGLIGLPAVILLLRRNKPQLPTRSPSARTYELTQPQFAFDSQLASTAG